MSMFSQHLAEWCTAAKVEWAATGKRFRKNVDRLQAAMWHRLFKFALIFRRLLLRYRIWFVFVSLSGFGLLALQIARQFDGPLAQLFAEQHRLETLKTLIMTVGAALFGATAIAFSFIMFAMQVNVERMPHGLFRKFSNDPKLMSTFGATFVLAIAIPTTALIPDAHWASTAIVSSLAGIVLVFVLLVYAYRRALVLINPLHQLRFVVDDAVQKLKVWDKRAHHAGPLLALETEAQKAHFESTHDTGRTLFFQVNPSWSQAAFQSLRYAISFSRRYAEFGDYEVSAGALSAVLGINTAYIATKGKTFFSDNALFEHPLSSDSFINETLETLRQNAQIAISRADEQQIEQTLRALAALVRLYAAIDYSNSGVAPKHAQLAAFYLAEAAQATVPHAMTDVTMDGIRLLGDAALALLHATSKPAETVSIANRIGTLGAAGAVNDKLHPLTREAVDRLARLSMAILKTKSSDVSFALREIDANLTMIARFFLGVPDAGMSTHSNYLAPYFSMTTLTSFQSWLTGHANAILQSPVDSTDAKSALDNMEEWSEGLYIRKKELLLLAIERHSHFAFDLIHWIANTSKLLIAMTAAPACEERVRKELLNHASWLISVLSWIPDTKEATAFAENYNVSEQFFEVGSEGLMRGVLEIDSEFIETMIYLLLDWGLREAVYVTGRQILEKAIYGCASLALATDLALLLKTKLKEKLDGIQNRNQEFLDHAAYNIRRKAKSFRRYPFTLRSIDRALEGSDRKVMMPLLIELADIISPNTSGETVEIDLF